MREQREVADAISEMNAANSNRFEALAESAAAAVPSSCEIEAASDQALSHKRSAEDDAPEDETASKRIAS